MLNLDSISKKDLAPDLEIKAQVLKDLESFAQEKNIPTKELIKEICKVQKISIRTFERIVGKSSTRPSNETLLKIYSFLYATTFLTDLLVKAPEVIANSIRLDFANLESSLNKNIVIKDNPELTALTSDGLFNIIYLMTSGDFGTDLTTIREEFGKRGLEMLDKMIKLRVVKVDEDEKLIREDTVFLSPDIRKNMLTTLIKDIYKPSKNDVVGENYSGYFMGDVTPEDFNSIYTDVKIFFDGIGKRIFNSRPTHNNAKKIVLGGVIEEMDNNKNGGLSC